MEELPQEDHPMEVLPEDQTMGVLLLEVLLMAELLPVDLLMEDRQVNQMSLSERLPVILPGIQFMMMMLIAINRQYIAILTMFAITS